MPKETITISYGGVNCYLLKGDEGCILVDTGFAKNRKQLKTALENQNCRAGDIKLILITHGDFDHTGNAAYLRQKYGAPIAMHKSDSAMAEKGDMLSGRRVNGFIRFIAKLFTFPPFALSPKDRFKADIWIEDNLDLAKYGIEARVIHIPGHSSGSVGLLSAEGDLYCGDLFTNRQKPGFSNIFIDLPVALTTLEKLKSLNIKNVYPGHGLPFVWADFIKDYSGRK